MADLGQGVAIEWVVNSTCLERGKSSDRTEKGFPGANVVPRACREWFLFFWLRSRLGRGKAPREPITG